MANIRSEKRELDRLHAQIPLDLVYRQDLPPGLSRGTVLLVYAVLDDHCAKNGENKGHAWPGYNRLMEKTGTGRAQIAAVLKWLQSIGHLRAVGETIETRDRKGRTIQRMKINEWILTARLVPNQNFSHEIVPQQNLGSSAEELDGSSAEELELESVRTITKEQITETAEAAPIDYDSLTPKERFDLRCKEIPKLVSHWAKKYEERFGAKPVINGGQSGSLLKRLLKVESVRRVAHLISRAFESSDPFIEKACLDLGTLLSTNVVNQLRAMYPPEQSEEPDKPQGLEPWQLAMESHIQQQMAQREAEAKVE